MISPRVISFGSLRDSLKKHLNRKTVGISIIAGVLLTIAFVAYLWSLYGQLQSAFFHQEQAIPSRIFSDVTRIAPPQSFQQVGERLKALGYTISAVPADNSTKVSFRLHTIDYPIYLIPDSHVQLDSATQSSPLVDLQFTGSGEKALLSQISIEGKPSPDLYLEPELVATLSGSGTGEKKQIREYLHIDNDEEMPPMIWKAIISIEDQHFLEHGGFDPKGLLRAIWVDLRTLSFAQGGSTITQQLVKNLMARRTKNVFRKVNELFLALLLEAKFDKKQILERYLNEVYLGQVGNLEVRGVGEGAEHFFGKKLSELNLGEVALMAGLIRGPAYYSPYRYRERAVDRQHLVLKKMAETGQIAGEEAEAAKKLPIRLAPAQNFLTKAPYFTDFVKAELTRQLKDKMGEQDIFQAGLRVYTTLDVALNSAAQKSVADGISDLEKRLHLQISDRLEGALASVDHTNGYIRALIGGKSYSLSNFNRILNMKRQVGSTFKPIVYLTAFAKGEDPNGVTYGPAYPMEDASWTLKYDHSRQSWSPKNYEKEYLGWITLRTALAHSINTVAAKLGFQVGIPEIIKTARALGVESDLPAVPSLALGVAELSPVELLRVYATIANHGVKDEITVIRGITQDDGTGFARFIFHPAQVFDAGATDLLTDTMRSVFVEGTAKIAASMGFTAPAAGKTGTTSHHRDSWFAGYTPSLTTVVWVGMDQTPGPSTAASPNPTDAAKMAAKDRGEEDRKSKIILTGATSALPIWVSFMKKAQANQTAEQQKFAESSFIADSFVDKHTGKAPTPGCPLEMTMADKYLKSHTPAGRSCESLWPTSSAETVAP